MGDLVDRATIRVLDLLFVLKGEGTLSEEEFAAEKAKILAR